MSNSPIHALRRILILTVLSSLAATLATGADERTGTRLEGNAARPSVLQLNRSSAIDEIRRLIGAQRPQAAVDRARAHVANLRRMQPAGESDISKTVLYDALNALCIALMTADQTDEALDVCSEAIASAPERWAAWNSRGTVYFVRENFDEAFFDFARALELARNKRDLIDTIQTNIRLANERRAPN